MGVMQACLKKGGHRRKLSIPEGSEEFAETLASQKAV